MTNTKKRENVRAEFMRILTFFTKTYRSKLFIIIVFALLSAGASLIDPFITKYIVDNVILAKQVSTVTSLLGWLVSMAILVLIINFFLHMILLYTAERFSIDLKLDLLKTIFHFPIRFFNHKNAGEVIYNLFFDAETVHEGIVNSIMMLIINLFTLLFALIAMVNLSVPLSFCIVVGTIAQAVVITGFAKPITRATNEKKEEHEAVMGIISDSINDIPNYKFTATENLLLIKVKRTLFKLRKKILRSALIFQLSNQLSSFVSNLTIFSILWWGAILYFENKLTIGTLLAFVSLYALFASPLLNIIQYFLALPNLIVSLRRYTDILEQPTEYPIDRPIWGISNSSTTYPVLPRHLTSPGNDSTHPAFMEKGVSIELKNLSFSFNEEQRFILLNCDLKINPHEKIAIYGKSGIGKSTLAYLLAGLYPAKEGTILINGHALQSIHPFDLRRNIFFLPQSSPLIVGSVKENLTLGLNYVPTEKQISNALQHNNLNADLGSTIPLDLRVGNLMSNLSFGEKKRIALSRLFLSTPKIIIFDELTAGLDTPTTKEILTFVIEQFSQTTIIFLTHSEQILAHVDQVYTIQNGQIIKAP